MDKARGKLGGNPGLIQKVNRRDNEVVNPHDKPWDKDTRAHAPATQKLEARSSSSKGEAFQESGGGKVVPNLDGLEAKLRAAAGVENSTHPALFDLSPILGLMDAGFDLDEHILPVLRTKAAKGKLGQSWKFYVEAIREAHGERQAIAGGQNASPVKNGHAADEEKPETVRFTDNSEFKMRNVVIAIERFAEDPDSWPIEAFGFPPGSPFCRVPEHLWAHLPAELLAKGAMR
jgi:hypothetical protein